jgi:peptidyl-prolyl cis-trans isomerase C
MRLWISIIGMALLVAVAACGERAEKNSKALAVINGKEITLSEFELRWSQLPEYTRKKYVGAEGRKRFLDELIDREILLQEARRRGIDRERTLLERLERFKERSLLDVLMREEIDSRVTVTTEEIKAYFDSNRDTFSTPDELRAAHILVRTEAEAADIRKRLAHGEDFAGLAKKTSLDVSTKNRGGDLGLIKKGQTVPEFERVLLTLKKGDISEPVPTQFGYHLIKLYERTSGPPLSFEEAKDQAKEQLLIEKKQKRFNELVSTLRSQAKLRVSDAPLSTPDTSAASPAADAR